MSILDDNLVNKQKLDRETAEQQAEAAAFNNPSASSTENIDSSKFSNEHYNELVPPPDIFTDEEREAMIAADVKAASEVAAFQVPTPFTPEADLAARLSKPEGTFAIPRPSNLSKPREPNIGLPTDIAPLEPLSLAVSSTFQLRFRPDRDTTIAVSQATLIDEDTKQLDLRTNDGKVFLRATPSINGREVGKWFIYKYGLEVKPIEFEENWLSVINSVDEFVVKVEKATKTAV